MWRLEGREEWGRGGLEMFGAEEGGQQAGLWTDSWGVRQGWDLALDQAAEPSPILGQLQAALFCLDLCHQFWGSDPSLIGAAAVLPSIRGKVSPCITVVQQQTHTCTGQSTGKPAYLFQDKFGLCCPYYDPGHHMI